MNNQEAINLLKDLEQRLDDYYGLNDEGTAAFGMAITALELFGNSEQLPSARPDVPDKYVMDTIYRQEAIDVINVLCREHRYRIPGKRETYSEYNEAWQDALDRAEGAICNLPPAQPYTADEIQKMQDLESAEIEKAYQLGYEEGKKNTQPERKECKEREQGLCPFYAG